MALKSARIAATVIGNRPRRSDGTFSPMPIEDRLWGRTEAYQTRIVDPSECWDYLGDRDDSGYGTIRHNGTMRKAHRVAWELVEGPIPRGRCVCHHCDNPPCINPSHLFLGSNRDNVIDRHRKGRSKNLFPAGDQHPRRRHVA